MERFSHHPSGQNRAAGGCVRDKLNILNAFTPKVFTLKVKEKFKKILPYRLSI